MRSEEVQDKGLKTLYQTKVDAAMLVLTVEVSRGVFFYSCLLFVCFVSEFLGHCTKQRTILKLRHCHAGNDRLCVV